MNVPKKSIDYPNTDYRNIGYPKDNAKPKPPKPKSNIAGFPAGTWRQAPLILPTMFSKRKRVFLNFTDKLKIVEQLKNGDSGPSLARKYGVENATLTDIKKNSDASTNYASALNIEDISLYRKVMRMAENKDSDPAVYTWFMQLSSQEQPISGPLICEKALEMNEKLLLPKMPTKSLVSKNEMSSPGYKASKSCITAMVCGNINGTHRLPLLEVCKSAVLQRNKNISCYLQKIYIPRGWIQRFL
ncbi:hypothetical protein LAZ67_3005031 [Cordylochernes scorpioides]|uniref:HTH psq-type domain-containing protein n=1 Tax=Cordylochernes scorpioides TaxID=51811 RepID=A0ABY6KCU0_9ARAC|nr:hypothetical protein LAZ67_3005031 [Cordylochernes scorpioides]